MRHISFLRYPVILLVMLCASCGTALPTIKPYKLDVQQGNVVTSKMLLQLRPGMTQSQVRFIMGTPLVQDSFHGKRWDYVYQMREGGKIIEQRRVILDFENDLLKTVRGDVVASASEAAQVLGAADNSGSRVITPSAKVEDKSLLSKLKFWEKDPAVQAEESAKSKVQAADEAAKASELDKQSASSAAKEAPKAVLEKVESAQPSAAPAQANQLAAVVNEPKVAEPVPVTEPLVEPAKPMLEPAKPVAEPEKIQAAPAVAAVEIPAANPPAAALANEAAPAEPIVTRAYNSSSGMQFDRTLRLAPEDMESAAMPEQTTPRAGNKTIPKPKDLPVDNPPSFFDRMLEKIGF